MRLLFAIVAMTTLVGCGSSGAKLIMPEDRLTKTERTALIEYARAIVLKSKKLNLSAAERAAVSRRPEARFYYRNHKTGGFNVSWQLSPYRFIKVKGEGLMTKPDTCRPRTAVINMEKTDDIEKYPLPPDKLDQTQIPPKSPAAADK